MARQIDPIYELDKFRHRTNLAVRFADLDALGHVNHTTYLVYMEQARMAYAADVWNWDGRMSTLTMIVGGAEIEYFAPLFLGDEVIVHTRVSRLGNSSFDYAYVITRGIGDDGDIVATGKTAMVTFDYKAQKPMPINEQWRQGTIDYENSI